MLKPLSRPITFPSEESSSPSKRLNLNQYHYKKLGSLGTYTAETIQKCMEAGNPQKPNT